MASLEENIPDQFDETSGFSPDDAEDDTFLLEKLNAYPGELPYEPTDDYVPEIQEEIEPEYVPDEPEPERTEQPEEEITPLPEEEVPGLTDEFIPEQTEPIKDEFIAEEQEQEFSEEMYPEELHEQEDSLVPEQEEEVFVPEENETEFFPEEISHEKTDELSSEELSEQEDLFVPQEQEEEDYVTDNLENEVPEEISESSEDNLITHEAESIEEIPEQQENKAIPEEAITKDEDVIPQLVPLIITDREFKTETVPQKKRSRWKRLLFYILLLILLLIAASAGYYFFVMNGSYDVPFLNNLFKNAQALNLKKETTIPDTLKINEAVDNQNVVKPEEPKPVEKQESRIEPESPVIYDYKQEHREVVQKRQDLPAKKQLSKDSSIVKKPAKPKPADSVKTVPQQTAKQKVTVKKPEVKKDSVKSEPKNPAAKPLKKPELKKDTAKSLPKPPAAKTPAIKKDDKITKPLPKGAEEYTIEIYSSPSLEDAQEWLGRLKRKNIDGFIKTQKVRDVIWYRVRFGSFGSREKAKEQALKLGFDQSWIDRVK